MRWNKTVEESNRFVEWIVEFGAKLGCRKHTLILCLALGLVLLSGGALLWKRTWRAVSLRQNGVSPNKTCANAILPEGHDHCGRLRYALRRFSFGSTRLKRDPDWQRIIYPQDRLLLKPTFV